MYRITINLAPWPVRIAICVILAFLAFMIHDVSPEQTWPIWVAVPVSVGVLLCWQVVWFDLATRSWAYERGIYPFIYRTRFGFEDLCGIELQCSTGGRSQYGDPVETFTALLVYGRESPKWVPLLSGRTFHPLAQEAVRLSMRIGTPILLGRDMHAFSERLADVQRSEAL